MPALCLILILLYTALVQVLGAHTYTRSVELDLVLTFGVVRLCLFLVALLVASCGFAISTKFTSRDVGYSFATMLFLGPTFVMFVYDVLRVMPHALYIAHSHLVPSAPPQFPNASHCVQLLVPTLNDSARAHADTSCVTAAIAWVSVIEIAVHYLQLYVQTSFVMNVIQLAPVPNDALTQAQYQRFKTTLVYLTLWNFDCWVNVSFRVLQENFDNDCVQRTYFDHEAWSSIWNIMVPVIAFYRFQSFVTFLMYWLKY